MYVFGGFGLDLNLATNMASQLAKPTGALVTTTGRITGTAVPGAVTSLSLLAKPGVQLTLTQPQLSPAAAAAMLAAGAQPTPSVPAVVPFTPAKTTPAPGTKSVVTEQAFAEACKRDLNGTVIAPNICRAADGAEVSVDATGQPKCRNQIGMCSPAAQAAAAQAAAAAAATTTPTRNVLMLGAAALAALMLLR